MRPAAPLLLSMLLASAVAQSVSSNSTNTTAAPLMYPLSTDDQFAFYLAEVLSLSGGGGASTGEVLRAATQITPGSFESFYEEFAFLADGVHAMGTAANASGFSVSARDAYFRSATYYRSAEFFLHANTTDPRLTTLWDAQLADFEAAIGLLPTPGEKTTVQGPNFTIPVYFYRPETAGDHGAKRPTVLVGSGYDGSQEALYHEIGRHILARGWNFATYEGPGQPTVRRQQHLGFIPNWWDVVTPVVDYLATRDEVDMDRLALAGLSFGGMLAPRAASREPRLAALLCIDGLYSMLDPVLRRFPSAIVNPFRAGNKSATDAAVRAVYKLPSVPTAFRWVVDQGLWAFNTDSPYEWLAKLAKFDLDEEILADIKCPVFLGSGENDGLAPGEAETAFKAFGDEKSYYYLFKTEYGAGEHCQLGAEAHLAMISLDWLQGVFDGNWLKGNGTVW